MSSDPSMNVRADELEYPALFLQEDRFTVRLTPPVGIASQGFDLPSEPFAEGAIVSRQVPLLDLAGSRC